jgi:hypothetical protein
VQALLDKGYLTLSSCEGHNISFSHFYITLAFGSEETSTQFVSGLGQIRGMTVEYKRSVANVKQVMGKNIKWQKLDPQEHILHDEYVDLNRMFKRRYAEYWFVIINLFASRRGALNVFWNISNNHHKHQHSIQSKQLLLSRIGELPEHCG